MPRRKMRLGESPGEAVAKRLITFVWKPMEPSPE